MEEKIERIKQEMRSELLHIQVLEAKLNIVKEERIRKRKWYEIKSDGGTHHTISQAINEAQIKCNEQHLQQKMFDPAQGLLELLEALENYESDPIKHGLSFTEERNESIAFKERDDISMRFLPLLGGIYFTRISNPTKTKSDADNNSLDTPGQQQSSKKEKTLFNYRLDGGALLGMYCFNIDLSIAVIGTKNDISAIGNKTTVNNLDIRFNPKKEFMNENSGNIFAVEELEELISIARKARNITQMFRNIVNFSEFDMKRQSVLNEMALSNRTSADRCKVSRKSASRICLSNDSNTVKNCLLLEWKYRFSLFGRGIEELTLEQSQYEDSVDVDCNVINNEGLQALIECYNGCCEKALRSLIHSIYFA